MHQGETKNTPTANKQDSALAGPGTENQAPFEPVIWMVEGYAPQVSSQAWQRPRRKDLAEFDVQQSGQAQEDQRRRHEPIRRKQLAPVPIFLEILL